MERERARAVQADGNQFPGLEHRLEIRLDVSPVSAIRVQEAGRDVEQRHVVVARHHENGERQ